SASLDVSPEAPLRSAQRSAALFGELGDRVGLAQALRATALALSGLGRLKEAEAAVAEGVDVARAVGDQVPLATLLSTQGGILLAARDARRAPRVGREAQRVVAAAYDALGDTAAAAAAVAEAEAIGGALDAAAGEQLRQILLLARVTSSS